MTLVVDACVVAAALADGGPVGTWSDGLLESDDLAAPHLMPVEAANVLRRAVRAGEITADTAALAHTDLLDLDVEFFAYESFGARIWELRNSVTAYDAWYVAVAESLDATFATLDAKLTKAHGPRCRFVTPP